MTESLPILSNAISVKSVDVGNHAIDFFMTFDFIIIFMQADSDAAVVLQKGNDHLQQTVLFALIPVVVAFSFIVFIFYRARREAFFKERETAFRLGISELQLKVLRTQISPHFIFNCLNSIHHFMHKNNVEAASDYLIKFSRLIRHVLETSYDRMIPLADEIQALKLYMELEQLRTRSSFAFDIDVDEDINVDKVHVPPLMIQPFAENAIWHGLNQKAVGGMVSIKIAKADKMLACVIEDNGKKSDVKEPYDLAHFVKRESHGMSLIQGRLEVINKLYKTDAAFQVDHLSRDTEKGTRVTLTLPYED